MHVRRSRSHDTQYEQSLDSHGMSVRGASDGEDGRADYIRGRHEDVFGAAAMGFYAGVY